MDHLYVAHGREKITNDESFLEFAAIFTNDGPSYYSFESLVNESNGGTKGLPLFEF